jgi:predicted RNA-binding Zn ribbon-like protein
VTAISGGVPAEERDRVAPGRLELVRQFVNTRDYWKGIDWIDSPERLSAWLVDQGLVAERVSLTTSDVRRVQAFREALRAMLLAHLGRAEPPEAAATFNETASSLSLRAHATEAGVELRSADEGLEFGLGSMVAAIAEAQLEGTWPRLKACANDDCRTGMYDRTKNRTRIWCNASTCGARMRARSYRRRRKRS